MSGPCTGVDCPYAEDCNRHLTKCYFQEIRTGYYFLPWVELDVNVSIGDEDIVITKNSAVTQ